MHFYDIIRKRDSIKNFTDRPIDNSKFQRIINSFLNSPLWKNNENSESQNHVFWNSIVRWFIETPCFYFSRIFIFLSIFSY